MANRAFCLPCGHDHISGIPTSTWRCRQCGFGSWGKITADDHLKHCPDHQVYETEHRFLDEAALDALILEKQAEALREAIAAIEAPYLPAGRYPEAVISAVAGSVRAVRELADHEAATGSRVGGRPTTGGDGGERIAQATETTDLTSRRTADGSRRG